MNKTKIVKAVQSSCQHKLTQAVVEDVINTFLNTVKKEIAAGNKVQLVGFGTFEKGHRSERKGKNPQTGEEMLIPAKDVPKFSAGKSFKDMLA